MADEMDRDRHNIGMTERPGVGWWLGQVLLTGIACFFAAFGVSLLVASYGLGDPYSFIMTFFAASFVLLISAALAITFLIKMIRVYRRIRNLS